MALPVDSLTLTPEDAGAGDMGSSLGSSMPGFAPLAMPVQSFKRFSRRDRRGLVAPRFARAPVLLRLLVFGGALALTAYGADQMFRVVAVGTITPLEWAMVVLFVVTFSWVTLSLTSAIVGFVWLLARRGRREPTPCLRERTAVVMPIYNEAPSRVFGAMQAIFEDVERTGQAHAFDFFLLSDTTDANVWIAEERAFVALSRTTAARPFLLPPAAQESGPQSRQHRRFRHSLGRPLSAYGRPRRRQSDDWRGDRRTRGGDGGGSRRRHHPKPASRRQPQHHVRAAAAVRGPDGGPGDRRGFERVDGAGRQLLGPQRDYPDARVRRPLRTAGPARQAAVRRAHPQPRFHRSGADEARGLYCLHAARPRRLVRREPALADRSRGSRPAMVPRQSPARADHRRQGIHPGDATASGARHHGLSRFAVMDGAVAGRHRARAAVPLHPARVFHQGILALPCLAAVRLRARAAAVRADDRHPARAKVPRPRCSPSSTGKRAAARAERSGSSPRLLSRSSSPPRWRRS